MGAGVNRKIAYPSRRVLYDILGYTKYGILPATNPTLFLNFLEKPNSTDHGVTFTITRSTATATYIDANRVLQTAAANTARFDHDPVTGAIRGLLIEAGATNLMLYSRDCTQAAWNTVTNMTALKDQTGIDAAATSASSLLATNTNAVITQSITSASATRTFSAYVKRLVGTGTVSITVDGSAYTDVTSSLVLNEWVRVSVTQAAVTNPVVGFKLATSADKIAVDYMQCESKAVPTSAVLSAAGQGARQADAISIGTLTPWFSATNGSLYAEAYSPAGDTGVNQYVCIFDDTTANERLILFRATSTNAPTWFIADGGATQATLNTGSWTASATQKFAVTYKANDIAASYAGAAIQTDTSATLPTVTNFKLGVSQASSSYLDGHIRRIIYWDSRLSNAMLVVLSTP